MPQPPGLGRAARAAARRRSAALPPAATTCWCAPARAWATPPRPSPTAWRAWRHAAMSTARHARTAAAAAAGRRPGAGAPPAARRCGLAGALAAVALLLALLGLAAGCAGLVAAWARDADLIAAIRAPRTLGAWLAGALLGLAGRAGAGPVPQPAGRPLPAGLGRRRRPGRGAGAGRRRPAGRQPGPGRRPACCCALGLVGAAFAGALAGVVLTLVLARGAARPLVLLLAGVVVGVVLTALSRPGDPALARGAARQAGLPARHHRLPRLAQRGRCWPAALALVLPLALRCRARSTRWCWARPAPPAWAWRCRALRLLLVALMALATGTAVAQAGLVAFVGLVAPHLVRRLVVGAHGRAAGAVGAGRRRAAAGGRRGRAQRDRAAGAAGGRAHRGVRRRLPAAAAAAAAGAADGEHGRAGAAAAGRAAWRCAWAAGVSLRRRVARPARPASGRRSSAPTAPARARCCSCWPACARADGGQVRLPGRPLDDWPARERAQRLAWLAQQGEAEGDIAVRDVVRLGRLPHQGLFGAPDAGRRSRGRARPWPRPTARDFGRAPPERAVRRRAPARAAGARAGGAARRCCCSTSPPRTWTRRTSVRWCAAWRRARAPARRWLSVLHDLTLALRRRPRAGDGPAAAWWPTARPPTPRCAQRWWRCSATPSASSAWPRRRGPAGWRCRRCSGGQGRLREIKS